MYPDQWVLVAVRRQHKDHAKKQGRVIAHSVNRADLDRPFEQFSATHPDAPTYEFFTGQRVTDDAVVVL